MRLPQTFALLLGAALASGGCKATLAVDPPGATVAAGSAPLRLSARQKHSSAGVTWSLAPGAVGSLTATSGPSVGYLPPRDLASPQEVVVSASAGSRRTSVVVTVTPPVEPTAYLGPEISVEAPPRGAFLSQGGAEPEPLALRGQVCDAVHDLTSLRVGSRDLPPGADVPCQHFETQVESRLGLTVVRGEAVNGAGEKGTLSHSFVRSPEWFSAASGDPAGAASSAVLLQLGQDFVDDGDRTTPDDLATLGERALAALDLEAVVGSPRFASPDADGDGHIDGASHNCVFWTQRNKATGFEAWKEGPLSHAGIAVDSLRLVDGGIAVRATLHGLRLPFAVTGNLDSGCLGDAQATVRGDAAVDALVLEGTAAVGLDPQGAIQLSFPAFAATLVGFHLDIDLGLLDFTGLGGVIGDAIAGQVKGRVQSAIRGAVQELLAQRLGSALDALSRLHAGVALPAGLGGGSLSIETGIDSLDFRAGRAVIGSSLRIGSTAPRPEHLAAAGDRGAMRLGGAPPDPSALTGPGLSLAVKDDALNQLLHAAWLSGAFDQADLSGLLGGQQGLKLAVFSRLPPVLMPRLGGAPGVDLGWGDVDFDLTLATFNVEIKVKGRLAVILPLREISIDPATRGVAIALDGDPEVAVQVDDVNWDHHPSTRNMAVTLLEGMVRSYLPQLLGTVTQSFALPDVDLRVLDPSLAGAVLRLEQPTLTRAGRYLVASGTVAPRP